MKKASEVAYEIGIADPTTRRVIEQAIEADRIEQRREAFEEAANFMEGQAYPSEHLRFAFVANKVRALAEREGE